ncbi:unnamed protein product [Cunninghamella blakesleeana]
MDIYALTRKRRPSRLTMAQTSSERLLLPDAEDIIEPTISVVTGPPTKLHWKLDEDAVECAYPGCTSTFGLFERRHHCRKCGDIFCSTHCSNYLRLNQDSEFHSKGYLSRGCDLCAEHWRNPTTSLSSSTSTYSETNEEKNKRENNKNRHAGIMTLQPHALEGVLELGRDDIVQSEDDDNNGLNKPTDVFDNNVAFWYQLTGIGPPFKQNLFKFHNHTLFFSFFLFF